MGRRTHKKPSSDDSFLWRICHAIDLHPSELAAELNVPYKEIKLLLKTPVSKIADPDYEETWWLIGEYVSKRIGTLMAIKYELNKMLQSARTDKVTRTERMKKHYERS